VGYGILYLALHGKPWKTLLNGTSAELETLAALRWNP
jgi:hypothetical protein